MSTHLSSGEALDPRVVRTRRLLEDALVSLLEQRPYSDVSVKDIAAEAAVNRATFYAHFIDKDDLFRTFLRNSFDRAVAERLGGEDPPEPLGEEYLDTLLPAVFEHSDWLAGKCRGAKTGRGVPPPEGELQAHLEGDVLRWLESLPGPAGADARRTVALAVSAMIASVATRWSRSAQRPAMEVVVRRLRGMIAAAIASVAVCEG